MQPKLEPCPFCGSQAELVQRMDFIDYRPGGGGYEPVSFCRCTECGAQTHRVFDAVLALKGNPAQEAIKIWNRRI